MLNRRKAIAIAGAFVTCALPSIAFGRTRQSVADALDQFLRSVTTASPQLLTQMGTDRVGSLLS